MASAYNITPDQFKEKWNTLLSYGKDRERIRLTSITLLCQCSGILRITQKKWLVPKMLSNNPFQKLARHAVYNHEPSHYQ